MAGVTMIDVLRIGHRFDRDKRITTHVCLVARAYGADHITIISEEPDTHILRTVEGVVKRWGGNFSVDFDNSWKKSIVAWRKAHPEGKVVHLTMYGEHISNALQKVPKDELLIVVGAEKVPSEIYQLADFNIAVGNQPHSEVAALATFLDRLLCGTGLDRKLVGELEIVPTPKGKMVIDNRHGRPSRMEREDVELTTEMHGRVRVRKRKFSEEE